MAKKGDTVRFLNTTGGGTVTRVEGKLLYVEENGFETPVLANEVVVVLPAGHEPKGAQGPKLMFDQKAFDAGRTPSKCSDPEPEAPKADPHAVDPRALGKLQETAHGDRLNVSLAFEPQDTRRLSETQFNAVLVNDSNYFLSFALMGRADSAKGWKMIYSSVLAPNELIDVAQYTHQELSAIEKVAFQCVAYKADREFELKAPVNVIRKIDTTKFHKLHCFRPGVYFDTPVLEFPLVTDDAPVKTLEGDRGVAPAAPAAPSLADLAQKYGNPKQKDVKKKPPTRSDADNPHKLLPVIEVDLHIAELTDTTAGMEPKDMMAMQLGEVERTMKAHSRRIGQKIVFIHGKGDGVLRQEVMKYLRKNYPKAELQDASFREYGFGATLVTIH